MINPSIASPTPIPTVCPDTTLLTLCNTELGLYKFAPTESSITLSSLAIGSL